LSSVETHLGSSLNGIKIMLLERLNSIMSQQQPFRGLGTTSHFWNQKNATIRSFQAKCTELHWHTMSKKKGEEKEQKKEEDREICCENRLMLERVSM
jgi:hypothetical protein